MFKANLIHVSYNMWNDDVKPAGRDENKPESFFDPELRFDMALWHDVLKAMSEAGMNTVILDLGDAVRYESVPEIAVEGALTGGRLKDELARCRDHGITPIPKLNFSACHDAWLGIYSRMVSTSRYYEVCRALIEEVCELFDGPEYFHLGMDEETAHHQRWLLYAVIRQGKRWWSDLRLLVEAVEKQGSTAWVWSDKLWSCGSDEFRANMPTSVIQSNWYYQRACDTPAMLQDEHAATVLRAFTELEHGGYRQVPTGSNFCHRENMLALVPFCRDSLDPHYLLGFCQTPWKPTTEPWRDHHMEAIEVFRRALEGAYGEGDNEH